MNKTGLLFLLISACLLLSGQDNIPYSENFSDKDSVVTATIAAVGDIMCHSVQFNYAKRGIDTFDFVPVYRYAAELISSADFAFGNFETVTAGRERGYSGYPFFNSPDDYITALKAAGFDLLTTSNNHSLDQGEKGTFRTIHNIISEGMGYNGTFINKEDRDSVRIYNINGIRIAFLAYSYGTNGIPLPKDKPYIINLIDTLLIKSDIEKTKLLKPDVIIVHYHFGEEYRRQPSKFQKQIVKKTIDYGADIIIGGHPHVLQPAEFLKGYNNLDSAFVIYSMGNFISNQRKRFTDAGVILQLDLVKNVSNGETKIRKVSITPTWVFRGSTEKGDEFVIIPYGRDNALDFKLSSENLYRMEQAFSDTKEMFLKDGRIRLK